MARCFALAGLVLAGLLVWHGAIGFRQDLVFTAAETEVSFWGRGAYQPDELTLARVGDDLDDLLSQSPAQPDYLTLSANYYAWRAYWSGDPDLQQRYSRRALDTQYAAQQSRPAYRQGWVTMVGYGSRIQEGAESLLALAEKRLADLRPGADPQSD